MPGIDILLYFGFTLLLLLCYETSSSFKYYTKYAVFGLSSVIFATIFIPLMLPRPRDYRNALFPAWGARLSAKFLGINFQVRGKENIVQAEGSVLLINHQSFIDLYVLAHIWPLFKRACVISKREIFYLWPFGLAAWLWGTVFIDRNAKEGALQGINQAATTITSQKAKICIFPEGTRGGGEKLLPFKKGAFHIAVESQAPIQPIVVTRYKFLDWKNHQFDEGSPMISILPAIETKGLRKENINSIMEEVYNAMSKEYDILNSL